MKYNATRKLILKSVVNVRAIMDGCDTNKHKLILFNPGLSTLGLLYSKPLRRL